MTDFLKGRFYYMRKNAHNMVTLALYHGDLKQPTCCEKCGSVCSKLDSHHEDYSKPLAVVWLCRSCHFKLHGYRGGENRKPKPSPRLQKALDYLQANPADLFAPPRELELKIEGVSYGTIHKAQVLLRDANNANQ